LGLVAAYLAYSILASAFFVYIDLLAKDFYAAYLDGYYFEADLFSYFF
jgi:hypothetical protein